MFYLIFSKDVEIATEEIESGNQDNRNNMSREPLRVGAPLTPYANSDYQVRDRHPASFSVLCNVLCLHEAGVYLLVWTCVSCGSHVIGRCPNP